MHQDNYLSHFPRYVCVKSLYFTVHIGSLSVKEWNQCTNYFTNLLLSLNIATNKVYHSFQ